MAHAFFLHHLFIFSITLGESVSAALGFCSGKSRKGGKEGEERGGFFFFFPGVLKFGEDATAQMMPV